MPQNLAYICHMYKFILFILLITSAITIHAQAIVKDSLIGTWGLRSIQQGNIYLGKDSAAITLDNMFRVYTDRQPGLRISAQDSSEIVEAHFMVLNMMEASYLSFNADGTAYVFFSLEDGAAKDKDTLRNYDWYTDNEILIHGDKLDKMLFKVVSLSTDKLVISEDEIDEGKVLTSTMTFRKL